MLILRIYIVIIILSSKCWIWVGMTQTPSLRDEIHTKSVCDKQKNTLSLMTVVYYDMIFILVSFWRAVYKTNLSK